jgi:hypothetical protein
MNQHTPTADNQIYTCPHCTFRAVQTTHGVITLDPGDDRAAHLAAIAQQAELRQGWVNRTTLRLYDQHIVRAVVPGRDTALSQEQLGRLLRAVASEYE